MMYLIRQSDKDRAAKLGGETKEYPYHTGEGKPRHKNGEGFEDVCEVYADGHELEMIRRRYTNLPDVPSSASMTWKGDFAQFIYDHLIVRESSRATDETSHYRAVG